MTLSNFLTLICDISTENGKYYNPETTVTDHEYLKKYFKVPRIYCKDGFNISIQINQGNYCSSENGYRTYGKIWERAEWGFPSEMSDVLKLSAEDPETRETVGSEDVKILQNLLDSHGGIDWDKTVEI